jgi:hypothetical protein
MESFIVASLKMGKKGLSGNHRIFPYFVIPSIEVVGEQRVYAAHLYTKSS